MKPATITSLLLVAASLVYAGNANAKREKAEKNLTEAHKYNQQVTDANKELAFALGVYKQNVVDIVSEYQKLYNVYTNNLSFVKDNFGIVIELPAKYNTKDAVKRQ